MKKKKKKRERNNKYLFSVRMVSTLLSVKNYVDSYIICNIRVYILDVDENIVIWEGGGFRCYALFNNISVIS